MTRVAATGIATDQCGNTIIEFAIVAPVMLAILMGMGDLLHQVYAQAILDGAVQKAARDSAIEGGGDQSGTIDDKVKAIVGNVIKDGAWSSTRDSYSTFSLVKPEYFYDTNNDNIRQPTECFDDVNTNGQWDRDPGRTGQGGANDVTSYTMTVTYKRIFPVAGMLGAPENNKLTSKTILKNQPYKTQSPYTIPKVCPT